MIFHQAVEKGRPVLQLIPIKRGGVKYQVCRLSICIRDFFMIDFAWLQTFWDVCFILKGVLRIVLN